MIDIPSRVGISSPLFSFSDLEGTIQEISTHFKRWEVVAELEHDSQTLLEKRDLLLASGLEITIHAPFSDLNIASLDQRTRELSVRRVGESIVAAHELGSSMVTMHPGFSSPLGIIAPGMVDDFNYESLSILARKADEQNVSLALENMPPWRGSIGDDVWDLLKRIKGTGLKICLDIGHAHIGGSIDGFFEKTDLIANVHIHENDGKNDLHMPLGSYKSDLDVAAIMKKLDERGYVGPFIIESRNLDEGVKSLDYLRDRLSD